MQRRALMNGNVSTIETLRYIYVSSGIWRDCQCTSIVQLIFVVQSHTSSVFSDTSLVVSKWTSVGTNLKVGNRQPIEAKIQNISGPSF
ncbi:unnamed protein product [Cylicocyclus nassatus]|uniref:Uncharacterized protein n=1 Tax=Cylicocyclus nassatus TaxID=53992 RepID=A0AA36GYG3_CYLNA|nr:unnamed protein product [Cylicocyclus nassatus]